MAKPKMKVLLRMLTCQSCESVFLKSLVSAFDEEYRFYCSGVPKDMPQCCMFYHVWMYSYHSPFISKCFPDNGLCGMCWINKQTYHCVKFHFTSP